MQILFINALQAAVYLNSSVMKPLRNNCPSLDKIYQGTTPYVKEISVIFRRTGNSFNVRIILKNKHTLRGTLMKTVLVRDAQKTKQCV
jgi:hypothetical protein